MFDYKAGLITIDELQRRQRKTSSEKDGILLKEIIPLEQAGYHCSNAVVKLPNGELKKIGYVFYADGIPQFND